MRNLMGIIVTIVLLSNSIEAQDSTEYWFGTLDVKVAKLRIELQITKSGEGTYQGRAVSIDQGSAIMPMNRIEFANDELNFEVKSSKASFTGKLNEKGDEIAGTFTQFGRPTKMNFVRRQFSSVPKHKETWQGVLDAGTKEYEFQIRISENGFGERFAVLDSFSENALGLALELEPGEEFKFSLPASAAKYVGSYTNDKKRITGKWQQSGGAFDLEFKSVPIESTRDPKLKRLQTPKPPFRYVSEDFVVPCNSDATINLAGTLTIPNGDGPFPVAVLISGSGPQDRDCTIHEHKSFWIIADHFAKNDIAVLRYDERGIGKSDGNFNTATTADFADDVGELVAWVKQHEKIDAKKVILIGHSEGGIVAPMVATSRSDVDRVIILAGPTVPGRDIVMNQTREIARISGAAPEYLDLQDELMERVIEATIDNKLNKEVVDKAVDKIFMDAETSSGEKIVFPERAKANLLAMDNEWFRYYLKYDPRTSLAKLKCPALFIIGNKDLQVSPELNLQPVKNEIERRSIKNWEIVRFDNLNHLFQESETGLPMEYSILEESFSTKVLVKMVHWINQK